MKLVVKSAPQTEQTPLAPPNVLNRHYWKASWPVVSIRETTVLCCTGAMKRHDSLQIAGLLMPWNVKAQCTCSSDKRMEGNPRCIASPPPNPSLPRARCAVSLPSGTRIHSNVQLHLNLPFRSQDLPSFPVKQSHLYVPRPAHRSIHLFYRCRSPDTLN